MHDDARDLAEQNQFRAGLAAAVVATGLGDIGGIVVRCRGGAERDGWLAALRRLVPASTPVARLPSNTTDDRLLGGLDLAATLSAGRPVIEHGVLTGADGGIVVAPGAERLSRQTAGRIATVMDSKEIALERDGCDKRLPTSFALVALDESIEGDEGLAPALVERLALGIDVRDMVELPTLFETSDIDGARDRYSCTTIGDDQIAAICETAAALGVTSLNAAVLASRVAKVIAALDGRTHVEASDVISAACLALAPKATCIPQSPDEPEEAPETEPAVDQDSQKSSTDRQQLQDIVLAAARTALPPHLLARLRSQHPSRARASASGRSGAAKKSPKRGRPSGVRSGKIGGGNRLNLIETLRTAAPWQPIRRRERSMSADRTSPPRVEVRASDFRIQRLKDRAETTTIFLVDASGSTAVQRLAEAKGAVELLLADCYSRRDHVALIAFSGRGTEILLPPTRSLARAKRNLADLPGGGGTPLASGLTAALALCDTLKRKGQTPSVVMLTDGRANLTRDGKSGRAQAEEEAVTVAKEMRDLRIASVLIDTSPKPQPPAVRIADAMGAAYVPLPHADAQTLSDAVKAQMPRRST